MQEIQTFKDLSSLKSLSQIEVVNQADFNLEIIAQTPSDNRINLKFTKINDHQAKISTCFNTSGMHDFFGSNLLTDIVNLLPSDSKAIPMPTGQKGMILENIFSLPIDFQVIKDKIKSFALIGEKLMQKPKDGDQVLNNLIAQDLVSVYQTAKPLLHRKDSSDFLKKYQLFLSYLSNTRKLLFYDTMELLPFIAGKLVKEEGAQILKVSASLKARSYNAPFMASDLLIKYKSLINSLTGVPKVILVLDLRDLLYVIPPNFYLYGLLQGIVDYLNQTQDAPITIITSPTPIAIPEEIQSQISQWNFGSLCDEDMVSIALSQLEPINHPDFNQPVLKGLVKNLITHIPDDKFRLPLLVRALSDWMMELTPDKVFHQLYQNLTQKIYSYFGVHTMQTKLEINKQVRFLLPLPKDITLSQYLEEKLHTEIYGQSSILNQLSSSIESAWFFKRSKIASFLFAGVSGTGKSQIALELKNILNQFRPAHTVEGEPKNAIDCTSYIGANDGFENTRLLGAPPGYIGYGSKTEIEKRFSYPLWVVEIAEIDKLNSFFDKGASHPLVQLFAQILDTGRITLSDGRDFQIAAPGILIFTANWDQETAAGFVTSSKENLIKKKVDSMIPPFLAGRLDGVFLFNPIEDKAILLKIIKKELCSLFHQSTLSIQKEVYWFILEKYQKEQGVRSIQRIIRQHLDKSFFYEGGNTKEASLIVRDNKIVLGNQKAKLQNVSK